MSSLRRSWKLLLIGSVGRMAGPACLVSSQSVALYELFQQGEWDEAIAAQRELWVMNQMFSKYNLTACIKGGLELQDDEVGLPLPPQQPLSASGRDELKSILSQLDAL